MMMTSGSKVHYKSMFDAGAQIVAKEGTKSLFKGAGANILRGVAGAGVLSLYDKFQELMFGKVYSGGMCLVINYIFHCLRLLQDLAKCVRIFGDDVYRSFSTIFYFAALTTIFPRSPSMSELAYFGCTAPGTCRYGIKVLTPQHS